MVVLNCINVMLVAQGSDLGSFGTGCMNTISKKMGPFSALSEWNEWINLHSKWVSYQPVHSIWVPFALNPHSIWAIFSPFNMGHLQHKYSLTQYIGSYVSRIQDVFLGHHCPIGHVTN